MKRFTYAMVMAVALVVLVSSFAIAGDDCKSKKVSTKATCSAAEKAACASSATVKAASAKAACSTAEKAACATSAKAACATPCGDKAIYKAASADMHKCCAEAVAAGKGCCGKEADTLKASYETKVAYYTAAATVTADMHKCCATSMAAGKGCCGHSADEMKADFDKKVNKELKKVATAEKASVEG